MSFEPLKTDYKNDVLKPSMNGKRHYQVVDSDGVSILYPDVILNDISDYEVRGDKFGKDDINAMNEMANRNRQDNEIIMPKVANIDEQVSSAELFASEANLAKNNAIMYSSYAEEAAEQARISAEKAESFSPENYNEFVASTNASLLSQSEHLSTLDTDVDDLKKSVSDGKSLVASAITDKGVETASDATFATMATNISAIETGSSEFDFIAELHDETKTYKKGDTVIYAGELYECIDDEVVGKFRYVFYAWKKITLAEVANENSNLVKEITGIKTGITYGVSTIVETLQKEPLYITVIRHNTNTNAHDGYFYDGNYDNSSGVIKVNDNVVTIANPWSGASVIKLYYEIVY